MHSKHSNVPKKVCVLRLTFQHLHNVHWHMCFMDEHVLARFCFTAQNICIANACLVLLVSHYIS